MKAPEVHELTDEEIEEEVDRVREELFRLRFRAAYQELENPALLRTLRRDLARLKTVRRERELVALEDEAR